MTVTPLRSASPADALAARLDDPKVAGALNTLLDHADLLAVLTQGLSGMIARSETIGESLADGVRELKATTLVPRASTTRPSSPTPSGWPPTCRS